ncbi:MAG: hypothetical protein V1908_02250 [Candidatus Peregrinibacteria bacterium]
MKRSSFAIVLLILILLFAAADYTFNISHLRSGSTVSSPDAAPNYTESLLKKDPLALEYSLARRIRTTHLFEKIDVTGLPELRVYQSRLEKPGANQLMLYEIQGKKDQGGLNYLNLKLKFLETLDATESLNETNEFGDGSFYFNDLNAPEYSFLMVQIKDNVFGFQFDKNSPQDFQVVKSLITTSTVLFSS